MPVSCRRCIVVFVLMVGINCLLIHACSGQSRELAETLKNGSMEDWKENGQPTGWFFVSQSGGVVKQSQVDCFEGKSSALIDATDADKPGDRRFANLMQTVDAKPWRGKKVRFRAAVKTDELIGDARAQLWFRVDRDVPKGENPVGAFDNMDPRPIRDDQWQQYDIVLKINDDAAKMVIGMFVIGQGLAWIDDATLTTVPDDTAVTDLDISSNSSESSSNAQRRRPQFSPILMKAFQEAESAPQQPFFNHWLWLVLIAVVLFALSALPIGQQAESDDNAKLEQGSRFGLQWIARFAFRFSIIYWLLYSFPSPIPQLIPVYGAKISAWHSEWTGKLVRWSAQSHFGIEHELVPPNGSGDTTYAYIAVFLTFCLAVMGAMIWSLFDWRKTDHRVLKDLLSSYLRYVLAFAMLGYGLAKVAWDMNQFPTIGSYQLDKTWGDSSPMNVIWSQMGASRAYTVFAGLGEVTGGLLLLFRRTSLLGAFVVLGVMINVMMLNYCYDIPVKLYSTHLVVMAIYLTLPAAGILASVLILNRPAQPRELRPPYVGVRTIWIQRAIKAIILIVGFAIPIYSHASQQIEYFANRSAEEVEAEQELASKHRLTRRGFRWINEVPFNR